MLLPLLLACTAPQPPDLVLVTWDTTRDDHVNARTAPHMSALAAKGARAREVRSVAPLTLPAHASLLTGLLPAEHGARTNGATLGRVLTLATRLTGAGYASAAFVSAAVLDPRYGLDRGFEHYSTGALSQPGGESYAERPGAATVAEASAWLATRPAEQPVFLWVHLFEPHRPWQAPPVEGLSPYEAEIYAADLATKALLDAFAPRGEPVVVLTADHGEGLGEHGEWTHGYFAYDSTLRVPLILSGGPFEGEGELGGAWSITDVAPALAALAGLGDRSALVDAAGGELPSPKRVLPFEAVVAWSEFGAEPIFGWVKAGESWHYSPRWERYDLKADPKQQHNLLRDADDMDLGGGFPRLDWAWPPPEVALDAGTQAQLEALGYLGGAESTPVDRDPKDRAPLMTLYQTGAADRLPQDALAELAEYEARWGLLPPIVSLRVQLLDQLGRVDEASALLRAQGQGARADARDAEQAERRALAPRIEAALAQGDDNPYASVDLALTLWPLGELERAEALLRGAVLAGEDERAVRNLGLLLVAQGRPEEALEALEGCDRAHLLTALGRPEAEALRACAASGGELTPRELAALAPR